MTTPPDWDAIILLLVLVSPALVVLLLIAVSAIKTMLKDDENGSDWWWGGGVSPKDEYPRAPRSQAEEAEAFAGEVRFAGHVCKVVRERPWWQHLLLIPYYLLLMTVIALALLLGVMDVNDDPGIGPKK